MLHKWASEVKATHTIHFADLEFLTSLNNMAPTNPNYGFWKTPPGIISPALALLVVACLGFGQHKLCQYPERIENRKIVIRSTLDESDKHTAILMC